ncbi:MAG: hypothetical protein DRN01_04205 [Thermoplasmata archaeon]|nr:MAG: hypothetical protein DRN01_04205 [Thermoplasmata archaeon]
MYYIVNHAEHIIAADRSLLELLSVENINELYTKIALGEIKFTTSSEEITITTKNGSKSYRTQNHMLSGVLGDITLVHIHPSAEDKIPVSNDEFFDLISDVEEVKEEREEKILFDDEPLDLISDVEEVDTEESEEKREEKILFDDEPFDLIPNVEEATVEEVSNKEVTTERLEENTSPIVIDIENISQKIGISTNDYKNFLNEYINTALLLEDDLKNSEEKKYYHAITTLSHLSNILHLPVITNIIEQIENSKLDDRDSLIGSLYAAIARLTTTQTSTAEEEIKPKVENTAPAIERDITTESFGIIDLSDVEPIHFDFQLEVAANDLGLPIELIEEFVHDFIELAHTETEKMLSAYEQGDLNTIQGIGHLLKGTASNLRITGLSDSLYQIQFCEDSNNLENLIKEYWGLFLSFENKIDLMSKIERK